MTRSPAELEAEIEASRRMLAQDLDDLRRKTAPRRLVGEALQRASARGRQAGTRLAYRARANPFSAATAVIGAAAVGLAVLLARRSRSRALDSRLARLLSARAGDLAEG